MEKNKIAIVIPVFNEEKTIISILKKVKKIGVPIVINDCSTDKTKKLLIKNLYNFESNSINLGYSRTLIKGLKNAYLKKFEYIISFDADNQHKIKDLKKIIKYLKKYDLVYTVRNRYGRASEILFSFLAQKIYKIYDPLSGLKGYRRSILKNYNFNKNINLFGSEILISSIDKNFKIKYFDIIIQSRKDQPRIGNTLSANLKILKSCVTLVIYYFRNKFFL